MSTGLSTFGVPATAPVCITIHDTRRSALYAAARRPARNRGATCPTELSGRIGHAAAGLIGRGDAVVTESRAYLPSMTTIHSWGDGIEYDPGMIMRSPKSTWWPVGPRVVEHKQLRRLLAETAQWHARQAIRLFVSDDRNELLQAAVSAGTAVELLAKTYLASVDSVLLADKGDRDTVLLLGGHGSLASADPLIMKTIGGVDALRLVKYLHKELPWIQQDVICLRVRNAAIHMALVQSIELRAAVVQMSRLVESILAELGFDRELFWGSSHEVSAVDHLLDEAKSERARIVAAKKAAAQRHLRRLLAGLSAEGRRLVLAALSGRPSNVSIEHEEPQECPICGQQGWLVCTVERGEFERQPEEDGGFSVWASRTAYPHVFVCPVCELNVEGEELWEFDFPDSIDIEPEDVSIEAYEPD